MLAGMKKPLIAAISLFLFLVWCLVQAMHWGIWGRPADWQQAWWQFRPLVTVGAYFMMSILWVCDRFYRLGVESGTPLMKFIYYSTAFAEFALCSTALFFIARFISGRRVKNG